MTVFLSYSRADKALALDIAQQVRAAGIPLWVDQLDIPVGAPWDSTIQAALHGCDSMLLMLSPRSAASPNVLDEVAYAMDKKKRIVPVLLEHCDKPLRLHRVQHIELNSDAGITVRQIVSELGAKNAGPPAKAPSPPPRAASHQAPRQSRRSVQAVVPSDDEPQVASPPVGSPPVAMPATPASTTQASVVDSVAGLGAVIGVIASLVIAQNDLPWYGKAAAGAVMGGICGGIVGAIIDKWRSMWE